MLAKRKTRLVRAIRFLAVAVFATVAFSEANACTCGFGRGPACQEAWKESVDADLLGRVEKIEASQGKVRASPGATSMTMMGGLLRVTITVEERFRGLSAIEVYTPSSSAACGFAFQQGERYLVYAWMTKDSELMVSLCSSTRPAKYAEKDIAYFRSLSLNFAACLDHIRNSLEVHT